MESRGILYQSMLLFLLVSLPVPTDLISPVSPAPDESLSTDSNIISGQVSTGGGNPIPDVIITAILQDGQVVVKDEEGNFLQGAQIYRNGTFAGTTGEDGTLKIKSLGKDEKII